MMVEFEGAWEDLSIVVELGPLNLHRHRLTGFLCEARFRVKRIQVRDATGHVAQDDALGPLRVPERPMLRGVGPEACLALVQEASQGQHAESARAGFEHVATGDATGISEHK